MEILFTDILQFIPQRPPMVMVDALIYSDENSTGTRFCVRENNIFVTGGFLTEPGLVENIAQTAAARAGYVALSSKMPVKLGYIGAIKNLSIIALPRVYDELETEITIKNQIFDVSVITGKIVCREKILATCEMKIFIINQ